MWLSQHKNIMVLNIKYKLKKRQSANVLLELLISCQNFVWMSLPAMPLSSATYFCSCMDFFKNIKFILYILYTEH